MKRNFREMLDTKWAEEKFVCVGLDSEQTKIPKAAIKGSDKETLVFFNSALIDATCDLVCAYKPNWAFYLALGLPGLSALIKTVAYINQRAPGVLVIGDIKVADIGNTNNGYVKAAFEVFGYDAITVHPYLGEEALQPFLSLPDKGFFVLCRTSNPGAGEFQDLQVHGEPLYQVVARQVATQWNKNNNCAVVVGATYPEELWKVRQIVGDMPILIPGIGAQGGDVENAVSVGKDSHNRGMIINSSRGIIFASEDANFAEIARRETIKLHKMINQYR